MNTPMNMPTVRTFDPTGWTAERVVAAKRGRTITLCFPCRDEAATIGELVTSARRQLVEAVGLVDELVVLDDRSTDDTHAVAAAAGATVVNIDEVHGIRGVGHGKGNALWASLLASHGDLIVWCDGDVTSFTPDWVVRLLAPLVDDDSVELVKASYHRPTNTGGGGRTTELVARPLLSLFAPGLAALAQPLSGEFAGRRSAMETIPFVEGWGVEIAMLFDIAGSFGVDAIAQVDLGVRHHRHRSLHALSVQAAEVMATALSRIGASPHMVAPALIRADGSLVPLNLAERPPIRPRDAPPASSLRHTDHLTDRFIEESTWQH
jgi:glucosyl-3-phosphoglycerate synthase